MKTNALKELERLAYEDKRKKYPGVPDCALVRTKYTDATTNDLQTCIVDYLDLIGGFGVRVNTQGQWVEKLNRHIPSSTKKGTPDIIGILPGGQFIGIECKRNQYDDLSGYQMDIRDDIEQAGGLHVTARVGQFQALYERIQGIINKQSIEQLKTA